MDAYKDAYKMYNLYNNADNSQWDELAKELGAMLVPGQYLGLELIHTSSGNVYALSVRDGDCPGSDILAVTDEKLLEKLRSVKGQYVSVWREFRTPIFYYEYLPPRRRKTMQAHVITATREGKYEVSGRLFDRNELIKFLADGGLRAVDIELTLRELDRTRGAEVCVRVG